MPWIETDREAALFWWNGKVDQPYRWAGNEIKDGGYDCSGLANGPLRMLGITTKDMTAADLARKFPAVSLENLRPGDLMFWENESGKIVHVEAVWYINKAGRIFSIGASGGGPWVTTLTAAQRSNAYVKRHKVPIGWVFARNPFGDTDSLSL